MDTPIRLLQEMLFRSFQTKPGSIALVIAGESYTYEKLTRHALQCAGMLKQQGIIKGDRVALYLDNTYATVVAVYGILAAGGVFVIINPQTKTQKLEYILKNADAKVCISDTHLAHIYEAIIPSIKSLVAFFYTGTKTSVEPQGYAIPVLPFFDTLNCARPLETTSDTISIDLAALIYTSGSTGDPKGVAMTHHSMVFTVQSLVEYLKLDSDSVIINVLPLAFDYGLYQMLMAIFLGATLILEKSFTYPAAALALMRTHKVSVFPGVPTMYTTLIGMHRRSSLVFPDVRRITSTAAALPADCNTALHEIFPNATIFRMYGLTECKRVCYLDPSLADSKPDSVGKAIPGTQTFLLSPVGLPTPLGEPGILHVRGAHIMQGYWKDTELTAKMLKPVIGRTENILCTGDWFKQDSDGDLYFLGRSDDIIKTRGEKVSPIEIERVLLSLKGIREAAVIGIPDALLGQSIKAFVSLDDKGVTKQDILKHCSGKLENFMIPKEVEILDSLPKTDTGKITKKNLH